MRILILTKSHPYKKAGVVALDLYKGLNSIAGNEVKLLVKVWDRYPDKNIIPLDSQFRQKISSAVMKFKGLLERFKITNPLQKKIDNEYTILDYDQTITYYSTGKLLKKVNFKPDVVIVLFMQHFLSFRNLYEINKLTKASIHLYLMDMAPMTGGCHYAWSCKGYLQTCGKCPAIYSDNENDQTRGNWLFKNEFINKTDISLIAGSEWQYRQLCLSSLFKDKPKNKILLGINSDIFKPCDQYHVRNLLKLPLNKKLIFFGVVSLASKRKGFDELIESLNTLKNNMTDTLNIHLVVAGPINKDLEKNLPFGYTLLGDLNHNDLALAFQSADLFLCPSVEDAGPMMINQSVMCGTPVVAFEMGVAYDLVITGETGYCAKLGDAKDLAYGMKYLLSLEKNEIWKIKNNCRSFGLKLCSPQVQVKQFVECFNINK